MKIREYSGPLTVLAAGVLGFSLICIVSAAALTNPGTSEASDLGAREIVNSAFSNPMSTAVAMTAVVISEYMPTPTSTVTATAIPSLTAMTYITPTRPFITWTPAPPTRTRMTRSTATLTPSQVPSRTPYRTPTKPPEPTATDTRIPTLTFTPRPTVTDTPVPTVPTYPTDTPRPTVPPTTTNTSGAPSNTPVVTDSPVPESLP